LHDSELFFLARVYNVIFCCAQDKTTLPYEPVYSDAQAR